MSLFIPQLLINAQYYGEEDIMKKYFRRGLSITANLIARIIALICYDKSYLKGKYFHRYKCSEGWKWVLQFFVFQKIIGINRHVPFPVSPRTIVGHYQNIDFDLDDMHIFQMSGVYFQALDAKLKFGKGIWIAPNTGFITSNHDINNIEKHVEGKEIIIGDKCWIGMNAVILPGVKLGPNTIVAAGAVVNKSFEEGYCVIGGNPAKLLKKINLES